MTSAPESADLPGPGFNGPGLPRDPADYGLRRRGLGAAFWAMMAFAFLCIVSGFAVGHFGSQWFPVKTASAGPAAPVVTANPGNASSVTAAASAPGPAATPTTAAPIIPPPASVEVAALGARVDRLQADQQRAALASGEALAAAALGEASQSPRRFDDQFAGLDRLLPDTTDLRSLRALAVTGAPTRSALAAEFANDADRADVASHEPPPRSSLVARMVHALASVFIVRRMDNLTGASPEAVLARAQRLADAGDLEAALGQLNSLPQPGRDALADWRTRAARRIEIDRLVGNIRAAAVRDLAAARGATP
jgi:hypothetical protein